MTDKEQPTCEIDKYGTKRWYLNNKYHRLDGPAIEYACGDKNWWINGKWYLGFYEGKWYDRSNKPTSETIGKIRFYQAVIEWVEKNGK